MDVRDFGLNPVRPEVFDSSMIADYLACESKFYLRHILGLKKDTQGVEAPALGWGSKWHDAMYAYHPNFNLDDALYTLDTDAKPWPSNLDEFDSHLRTLPRMYATLAAYHENYYERDKDRVVTIRREQYFNIMVEAGDETPFGISPVTLAWCGRIDRLIEEDTRPKNVDYKTTSRLSSNFIEEHKHGFQFPGYTFASSILQGEFIRDTVLDVLYTLKAKQEFMRPTIRYTKDHILEWMTNMARIVDGLNAKLDESMYDLDAWIQNRNSCFDWSRPCAYADVHFSPDFGGNTRLPILVEDYVESRWNPADI